MDNKEYGVKLTVDISDLQKKIEKAKQITDEAKKAIEEPLRKVKITRDGEVEELKIKADTNPLKKQLRETVEDFEKRMANVKPKIYDNSFYNPDADRSKEAFKDWYGGDVSEKNKYWRNLRYDTPGPTEDLSNLKEATEDMQDLGEATNDTGKEANKTTVIFARFGDDVSKTIKRSVANIKRFSLSLFGIHSAWTALSRAVRSYMAYDEKANQRLQANWIALGAMFAPIVEKISVMIQRLVGYINVFYKALTGKDFISIALDKVKAKANGTSKAVKSLNKELANFDEITNLDFDKGNENDLGIAEALSELKDIDLNPEIVKKVEGLAKEFKENVLPVLEEIGKFITDTLIPGIGQVYSKFEEWGIPLGGVLTTIGLITGGITGGLMTAIGLFIFKLWEAYDVWKEFNKSEDRLYESRITLLETHKTKLQSIQRELDTLSEKESLSKEEIDRQNELIKEKEWRIQECQDQYEEFNEDIKNGKVYSREQAQEIENIGKEIDEITKGDYNIDFNIDVELTKQAKNTLNELERILSLTAVLTPLMSLPLAMITAPFIDSWLNKNKSRGNQIGALKNLKGLAKGNVAYGPTVAEFGEYAGARTNPEITTPQSIMKQTMVEALQEAMPEGSRGGDTVLYVNGKELARATYGDFQTEGNRLGTSNVAIRRV